jgi:hypothetical protein
MQCNDHELLSSFSVICYVYMEEILICGSDGYC